MRFTPTSSTACVTHDQAALVSGADAGSTRGAHCRARRPAQGYGRHGPHWQPARATTAASRTHVAGSPAACYGRPPYPPHRCPQLWTTVWTCLHAGRMPSTNRERNAIGSQREASRQPGSGRCTLSDEEEVWTAVAQLLRAQVTESVWFSTFQDVVPVVSDGDRRSSSRCRAPSPVTGSSPATCRSSPTALEEIGVGGRRFDVEIGPGDAGGDRRRRRARGRPVGVRADNGNGRRRPTVLERRRARRGRAEPALHVRDVRQGGVQPVRRSPPRCASPRRRPVRTTRCSSTARPVSARPTCCTPSGTTCTTTTSTTRCATSRPRRS